MKRSSTSHTNTIAKSCKTKLSQAKRHYSEGNYRKALSVCESIYILNASYTDNLLLLGAIHLQLRNLSESIFYNQQCLRVDQSCSEAHANIGNALKELGDTKSASNFFDKAIRIQPRFVNAYCNLASTQFEEGHYKKAIESFQAATTLQPRNVHGHCNLGNVYKSLGDLDAAKQCFIMSIKIDPRCAIAWSNLGGIFYDDRDYDNAITSYQHALNLFPNFPDAHSNLGNALLRKGMSDCHENTIQEALKCYRKAAELRPDFAVALGNLGMSLYYIAMNENIEGSKEVQKMLQRSIQLDLKYPDALNNLGVNYLQQGRLDDAIKCFLRAIRLKPDHNHVYNNLGICLIQKDLILEGIHCYNIAMKLANNFSHSILNSTSLLHEHGLLDDDGSCARHVLENEPEFISAYLQLGNALRKKGKIKEAIHCYEIVTKSRIMIPEAYFNLASLYYQMEDKDTSIHLYRTMKDHGGIAYSHYLMAECCDWSTWDNDLIEIGKFVSEKGTQNKFISSLQPKQIQILPNLCPKKILEIYETQSTQLKKFVLTKKSSNVTKQRKSMKMKVGYVSSFFDSSHPIGFLTQGLYELHNKQEFEIFCYSIGAGQESCPSQKIPKGCNHFLNISSFSAEKISHQVQCDNIDILVYLDGYTSNKEINLAFAMHRAPLQINFMGNYCTLGNHFDYIIGDQFTIENQKHFSEKIIYLEGTFAMTAYNNTTSLLPEVKLSNELIRSKYGLSDDLFVYACFNQPFKIDPIIFSSWMEILNKTEQTVLLLVRFDKTAEENIKQEALKRNINTDRIVFVDLKPFHEHIQRCHVVDLFLDTRTCNGMATTCDALWSGIPMLTIAGSHMHNRVGASLMKTLGMEKFVVDSLDDYVNLAISLNQDESVYISAIRNLEEKRSNSAIFDGSTWMKGYERALKKAFNCFESGCTPEHIQVMQPPI